MPISPLVRHADTVRRWINFRFDTEFTEVLHAAWVKDLMQCVVRDSKGFLWLCEETRISINESNGLEGTSAPYPTILMPIWGPAPDPIEPLPQGYSAETTALLAEAAAMYGRGRKRKAA